MERPLLETAATTDGRFGFGVPDHPDEGARVRYRRARGLGSGLRRRERDRLWREDERRNLWGEGALGRCTRLSRPRADAWTAARWIGRRSEERRVGKECRGGGGGGRWRRR